MKANENHLMVYSMTDDTNFAPHIKGGWISLACCAGPVRENAKIGDIILGVGTKELEEKVGVPNHTIIFLMKVTEEPMKFNEYFNNDKFIGRIDNFYKKKMENIPRIEDMLKTRGIFISMRMKMTQKNQNMFW